MASNVPTRLPHDSLSLALRLSSLRSRRPDDCSATALCGKMEDSWLGVLLGNTPEAELRWPSVILEKRAIQHE